eukprot:1779537-Rhodomonas_salina.1
MGAPTVSASNSSLGNRRPSDGQVDHKTGDCAGLPGTEWPESGWEGARAGIATQAGTEAGRAVTPCSKYDGGRHEHAAAAARRRVRARPGPAREQDEADDAEQGQRELVALFIFFIL